MFSHVLFLEEFGIFVEDNGSRFAWLALGRCRTKFPFYNVVRNVVDDFVNSNRNCGTSIGATVNALGLCEDERLHGISPL
jgi:hypothetical protein